MCGEQLHRGSNGQRTVGSPPRVRGTGPNRFAGRFDYRITPACAGNSRVPPQKKPPSQDHPRVCGEQTLITQLFKGVGGSPPRVRGTASTLMSKDKAVRITPACAGNRFPRRRRARTRRDHPRVCGEQTSNQIGYLLHYGSPPRVRGTVLHARGQAVRPRITPACAGNSAQGQKGDPGY